MSIIDEILQRKADKADRDARDKIVGGLMGLLVSEKYDPTVEGSKLHAVADECIASEWFKILLELVKVRDLSTTGIPCARDFAAELHGLIDDLFPIGIKGGPKEVDGQEDPPGGADDRVIGMPEALGAPYGAELDLRKEGNELIAAIEKAEGRDLSAAERDQVRDLLTKTVSTNKPELFVPQASKGSYLIIASKSIAPEDIDLRLLRDLLLAPRK